MTQDEIKSTVSHTDLQALMLVVQQRVPHLSRDALQAGFSGADLRAWLEPQFDQAGIDPTDEAVAARAPRGSYATPNARLRAIRPEDIEPLYQASISPRTGHRWRFS